MVRIHSPRPNSSKLTDTPFCNQGPTRDDRRTEMPIPTWRLHGFCRRWKIAELRVFSSALVKTFVRRAIETCS